MQSLFSQTLLPVTLAFITLGMGLSLTAGDFRNIFVQPRAVITGLCCQMILLPAIAFLIAGSFHLDPYLRVGLMIIAACPGGATSNLITYMLRGKVALSISMTAINSLITLITIPLVVGLALSFFMHQDSSIQMDVPDTILKVFLITILPVLLGTRIRKLKPGFANRLEKPLRIILPLLLLLIFAGVIFIDGEQEGATRSDFVAILPYTLLLNVAAMLAGLFVARGMRLDARTRYTIAIEVGLQNSGLAIVVAMTILGNRELALVPLVYGSFTFFSTLFFGWVVKRLTVREKVSGTDGSPPHS